MKQNLQTEDLPYEKFRRFGAENLSERELLAIMLRTGTKDKSALELAGEVMKLCCKTGDGLAGLFALSERQFKKINGIGEVKAVQLKCLSEICKRLSKPSSREGLFFQEPQLVADYYMELLGHENIEYVHAMYLDSKCRLLGEERLSSGSARMSIIPPREIFMKALDYGASSLILVHNHPSGDPNPSQTDIDSTTQIYELGKLMEIPLLDHVIIGNHKYYSFKEKELI